MLNAHKLHQTIDEITQKLSDHLPDSMKQFKVELEASFRGILQNGLSKLDLVTREEFDTQAAVLLKTRVKLEALEQLVGNLEKKWHPDEVNDRAND